ncbi:MAG TPA: FAD:protein FMN transferase [Candidatus Limnocylindrales bacterium]|nr:FAD:protein FMN transferase [Candidatus Limnocylindrales bacterium]
MMRSKRSNPKLNPNPPEMKSSKHVFDAIGTKWSIEIGTPLTDTKQAIILTKIKKRIDLFDKTYSRFLPDSLVTKMSQKKGKYLLPADAEELLKLYKKLYDITDHAFTPLIGNTLSDAGYDADYSLKPKNLTKPLSWSEAFEYLPPYIEIHKPVLLDFGAAGKGYIIDIIGQLLIENKINDFCIDAGGDILYKTSKNESLRVGLEHLTDPTQVIGIAEIQNQSICASSGNRRKWAQFHHIINPNTLKSPTNTVATWAIADTGLIADGITTALFFKPAKLLRLHFNFDYLVVFADKTYEISSNFPGELYTDITSKNI